LIAVDELVYNESMLYIKGFQKKSRLIESGICYVMPMDNQIGVGDYKIHFQRHDIFHSFLFDYLINQ